MIDCKHTRRLLETVDVHTAGSFACPFCELERLKTESLSMKDRMQRLTDAAECLSEEMSRQGSFGIGIDTALHGMRLALDAP